MAVFISRKIQLDWFEIKNYVLTPNHVDFGMEVYFLICFVRNDPPLNAFNDDSNPSGFLVENRRKTRGDAKATDEQRRDRLRVD